MAPQIDATYRQIDEVIGAEFCEHFYEVLDRLVATLKLHAPV